MAFPGRLHQGLSLPAKGQEPLNAGGGRAGIHPQGPGNRISGGIALTCGIHVQGNDAQRLPVPIRQRGQKPGAQGCRVQFNKNVVVPLFVDGVITVIDFDRKRGRVCGLFHSNTPFYMLSTKYPLPSAEWGIYTRGDRVNRPVPSGEKSPLHAPELAT